MVEISEPSNGPQIGTLFGGSCVTGGGGPGHCAIGLKIPRDFTGAGSVTLGRPAKPGEAYESTNSAFAPGESLHCSALIGKTVAAAKPELGARGITVDWRPSTSSSPPPAIAPVPTSTSMTATSTTATDTTETSTTETSTTSASKAGGGVVSGTGSAGLANQYVVDGDPISAGVVMLQTQAQPRSPSQIAQATQTYDAGC